MLAVLDISNTVNCVIIGSVVRSVVASLHVVKCVKWSSFVADRITLLCVCMYVRMCFCVRVSHSVAGRAVSVKYS